MLSFSQDACFISLFCFSLLVNISICPPLLFSLCESDAFQWDIRHKLWFCVCVHHWLICKDLWNSCIIIIIIIFMRWGTYGSKHSFPSVGVGKRHLSITAWWLIWGPPTVLSQSLQVPGSECVAPDNPQTHSESSRAQSFKPLRPSLLFKHSAEHLFWSRAIVSDGPIMEICLKCFALRPSELHRLHLLMCWACKQLLSPQFLATFLHNLVSPSSTCTLGHVPRFSSLVWSCSSLKRRSSDTSHPYQYFVNFFTLNQWEPFQSVQY